MTGRAVIFDLDGTLLDTLADLTASVNHVMDAEGLPRHPAARVRRYIGSGARTLISRATPEALRTEERLGRMFDLFEQHYRDHWADTTRPYPGIPALLAALGERGVPLAVLSNKPHPFTEHMVARLLPPAAFSAVLGAGLPGLPLKPHPAGALEAARRLGSPPQECLLVGDSPEDLHTARAAGMSPVAVSWGFRDEPELMEAGADVLLREPGELLGLLP